MFSEASQQEIDGGQIMSVSGEILGSSFSLLLIEGVRDTLDAASADDRVNQTEVKEPVLFSEDSRG